MKTVKVSVFFFGLFFLAAVISGCGSGGGEAVTTTTITTTTAAPTTTTVAPVTTTTAKAATTTTIKTTTSTTTTTIGTTSAPVFATSAGSIDANSLTVTIEAGSTGADSIRYTLDGSTPTATSGLYDGPFVISTSKTVKAKAFKSGYNSSAVASAGYDLYWWQPLGSLNGTVETLLVVSSETVYAGGQFTGYALMWNGTNWGYPPSGIFNDTVYAIIYNTHDNKLYIGGSFTTPGNRVVAYNSGAVEQLTDGADDGAVYSLAADGDGNVYCGGSFTSVSSEADTAGIAKWNIASGTWEALDRGVLNTVYSLAYDSSGNTLYVGGDFPTASGVAVGKIAAWKPNASPATWESLPSGTDPNFNTGPIRAMVKYSGSVLLVGGNFTSGPVSPIGNIAYYDTSGGVWTSFSESGKSGVDNAVRTVVQSAPLIGNAENVIVGGDFVAANGGANSARHIARSNLGGLHTWTELYGGTNGPVHVIKVDPNTNDIYIGGYFTEAGGVTVSNVARFAKKI